MVYKRFSHSATLIGGNLFLFGGAWDRKYLNDLQVLNTTSMTLKEYHGYSGKRPSPREGHGAAAIGDYLYIFGGYDGNRNYLADLFQLSTRNLNFVWVEIEYAGKISPRRWMSFWAFEQKLYLFGGYGGG